MSHDFKQIESRDELREIYDEPMTISVRKEIDRLDEHCRDFLALSPFMVIGSTNAQGHGDLSPKGDKPGFVQVLDDTHLLIPDRPGNNRLDTMQSANLGFNPWTRHMGQIVQPVPNSLMSFLAVRWAGGDGIRLGSCVA
ncbi:MAG: putative pyridoxine 5'-phosphate oxidase superfamily flavin-nucleotide-binding protein [Gammaproteobacteria bacterium]|jgi:predicted pyridoxine 5'-phosphate oxidase superfamily flavin-nucleotide-binding protein